MLHRAVWLLDEEETETRRGETAGDARNRGDETVTEKDEDDARAHRRENGSDDPERQFALDTRQGEHSSLQRTYTHTHISRLSLSRVCRLCAIFLTQTTKSNVFWRDKYENNTDSLKETQQHQSLGTKT